MKLQLIFYPREYEDLELDFAQQNINNVNGCFGFHNFDIQCKLTRMGNENKRLWQINNMPGDVEK